MDAARRVRLRVAADAAGARLAHGDPAGRRRAGHLVGTAVAVVAATRVDPDAWRTGARRLRIPHRPRYRLRRPARAADAQALRNAFQARCLQPAWLFAVRALRCVPAGPGADDAVPEPARGGAVAGGLVAVA